MYAVYRYREDEDDRREYHNLMFVTSNYETAEHFVNTANREFSRIKEVPVPKWSLEDISKFGPNYHMELIEKYNAKLFRIWTLDEIKWPVDMTQRYYYERVEER